MNGSEPLATERRSSLNLFSETLARSSAARRPNRQSKVLVCSILDPNLAPSSRMKYDRTVLGAPRLQRCNAGLGGQGTHVLYSTLCYTTYLFYSRTAPKLPCPHPWYCTVYGPTSHVDISPRDFLSVQNINLGPRLATDDSANRSIKLKMRFLCLHGRGTDAEVCAAQTRFRLTAHPTDANLADLQEPDMLVMPHPLSLVICNGL